MSLQDDLYAIERGFWEKGEDYFLAHVDECCLISFADMAGAQAKEKIAATARDRKRWKDLDFARKGFVQPTEDVALINYEAKATRPTGEPYRALVSTGYVHRRDGWKIAFHGQTPLEMK